MIWIERAKVGDKIVCVISGFKIPSELPFRPDMPACGKIYTIREFVIDSTNTVCLRLVEIVNPPAQFVEGLLELAFHATCFRPVKDTTLQVEALKRICLKVPEMAESPTGRSLPPARPVGVLLTRSDAA